MFFAFAHIYILYKVYKVLKMNPLEKLLSILYPCPCWAMRISLETSKSDNLANKQYQNQDSVALARLVTVTAAVSNCGLMNYFGVLIVLMLRHSFDPNILDLVAFLQLD